MPTGNFDTSVNGRLLAGDGKMLKIQEHFDPFITSSEMKTPSMWRDRLAKGVFPLFQGYSQKQNIFRGTLGVQSGLNAWSKVKPSTRGSGANPGYDACAQDVPQTYDWSYDTVDFEGYKTSWKSPTFCLDDLKYIDFAKEQISMIIRAGAQVTDQTKETFNRENYIKAAVDAGKGLILCEGGLDYIDNSAVRFNFNPYAVDADGDQVLTFQTSLLPSISTLNWSFLDYVFTYMTDQCPDAAIGTDSGMPTFGLMIDVKDFERYITSDSGLTETMRYLNPGQLISGFNMGFKVYRQAVLIHDARQPRFTLKSIDNASTSMTTLKRVNPRRATRPGTVGYVPETNPAYIRAEFALGVVFMNDVIQILVPPSLNNLGSGLTFGPANGFNGEWNWLNIQDEQTNRMRNTGYFYSRFEYYVKPMLHVNEAVAFLYRRCPQALATGCAIDSASDVAAATDKVTVVTVVSAAESTNNTLRLTLAKKLPGGTGDRVYVDNDGSGTTTDGHTTGEYVYIADASMAPTYTFVKSVAWSATPTAGTGRVSMTAIAS